MTTYHSTKHRQLCKHCGEDRGAHGSVGGYCPDLAAGRGYLKTVFEAAPRHRDKELAEAEEYIARQSDTFTKMNTEISKLERKVRKLQRDKATSDTRYKQACDHVKQLQARNVEDDAKIDDLRTAIQQYKGQIADAETDCRAAQQKLATAELDTRTAQVALADVRADLDRELAKNETLLAEAKARDASEEAAQAKAARQTAEINRLSEQLASEKRARKDAEAARSAHIQADADAMRRHAALRETDAQTIRRLQRQRDRMGTTIAQLEAQRKNLGVAIGKILGSKVTSETGNVELDVICMALEVANRRPSDEEQYEQE